MGAETRMAGQLLPPPGLDSPLPEDTTPEQGIRIWIDLMRACEQFLLAGLRREIGPEGDLRAAYRQWCAAQDEEHDRMIRHLVDEFNRREGATHAS